MTETARHLSEKDKLRLKRKLYNVKLKPGDFLQEHLKCFSELFEELAVIGDPIAGEEKVINLLASLPDQLATPVTTALEAMDKTEKDSSRQANVTKISCSCSDDDVTLFASALPTTVANNDWIIDSGDTQHMCNSKKYLSYFAEFSNSLNVEVGDGRLLSAVGEGTVRLKAKLPDGKVKTCVLEKVLFF
ncbi:uncharacterized protein [Macrobrachium rosenbergii]|uniref:uncharacterized protein n=1 Tax=Macrobrachium rosenbergii TaxID=79674 RepID=UPI0034D459C7